MNIVEYAKLKKMFGNGGGGTVEGTAIPVGEKVEKIYFNTALSIEETNAYLSQLTYVDIGFDVPLNMLYAQTNDGITGYFFAVLKMDAESYHICLVSDIASPVIMDIFDPSGVGWEKSHRIIANINSYWTYGDIAFDNDLPVLTDFNGLPVGAENEKIKNVLSITPFTGTMPSNEPTAYTVSSVDELPSDAVDGSLAIVDGDIDIEGTWYFNQTITQPHSSDYFEYEVLDNDLNYIPMVQLRMDEYGMGWDLYYVNSNGDENFAYCNDEENEDYYWADGRNRYIRINNQIPSSAEQWIRENAIKLSSLYIRENGEWVYKGEVA